MLKILAGHMILGGLRPPPCRAPSRGSLVFSAFASACIFCFCPILHFLPLPHLAFSAFGPYCMLCTVFYQLPCFCRLKPFASLISPVYLLALSVASYTSQSGFIPHRPAGIETPENYVRGPGKLCTQQAGTVQGASRGPRLCLNDTTEAGPLWGNGRRQAAEKQESSEEAEPPRSHRKGSKTRDLGSALPVTRNGASSQAASVGSATPPRTALVRRDKRRRHRAAATAMAVARSGIGRAHWQQPSKWRRPLG